jgi:two-component system sensor histidine kinase/response regulator
MLGPRRVLVADDNPHSLAAVAEILGGFGLHPTLVESADHALAELTAAAHVSQDYELLLMDWRMPGLAGIESVRRVRAQRELAQLPIVLMVTAFGPEEVLQSAEDLGLASVLIKPFTRSMMLDTLTKIFVAQPSAAGPPRHASSTALERGLRIPAGAAHMLADRRVLIVDDNALNREVVTDLLLAVKMQIDSAADGLEALRKVAVRDYDVVLMDVRMPGMDGLTAARRMRSQPRSANLPIIALTAQVMAEERAAMLETGMNAHLKKPIDEAALYGLLMTVLAPPASNGFSLARLGNDPVRLRHLLSDFLRDTATTPQRLSAHVAADEMAQAAALVHSIRGAAYYMEANSLCAVAARFEAAARQLDIATVHATVGEFNALLAALREFLAAQLNPAAGGIPTPLRSPGTGDDVAAAPAWRADS